MVMILVEVSEDIIESAKNNISPDYKIITISLPLNVANLLDILTDSGVRPSRSWIIRECIFGHILSRIITK